MIVIDSADGPSEIQLPDSPTLASTYPPDNDPRFTSGTGRLGSQTLMQLLHAVGAGRGGNTSEEEEGRESQDDADGSEAMEYNRGLFEERSQSHRSNMATVMTSSIHAIYRPVARRNRAIKQDQDRGLSQSMSTLASSPSEHTPNLVEESDDESSSSAEEETYAGKATGAIDERDEFIDDTGMSDRYEGERISGDRSSVREGKRPMNDRSESSGALARAKRRRTLAEKLVSSSVVHQA